MPLSRLAGYALRCLLSSIMKKRSVISNFKLQLLHVADMESGRFGIVGIIGGAV